MPVGRLPSHPPTPFREATPCAPDTGPSPCAPCCLQGVPEPTAPAAAAASNGGGQASNSLLLETAPPLLLLGPPPPLQFLEAPQPPDVRQGPLLAAVQGEAAGVAGEAVAGVDFEMQQAAEQEHLATAEQAKAAAEKQTAGAAVNRRAPAVWPAAQQLDLLQQAQRGAAVEAEQALEAALRHRRWAAVAAVQAQQAEQQLEGEAESGKQAAERKHCQWKRLPEANGFFRGASTTLVGPGSRGMVSFPGGRGRDDRWMGGWAHKVGR